MIGLVLAAGAGSRMGLPKALVRDDDGTSWLARSVEVLAAAGCDELYVVLGARHDEALGLVPAAAEVVVAEDWADGMAASLRAGLRRLTASAAGSAAVITLVDLPDVTPAVVVRVAAGVGAGGLARATYAGRPGHPVVAGRDHWEAMAVDVAGDQGARSYLAEHGCVPVECGDLATGRDVDAR